MDVSRIDRINELYHKSQATGLTEEEKEEQARLRREYIAAIRGSLRSNLNLSLIHILRPRGQRIMPMPWARREEPLARGRAPSRPWFIL